MYNLDTTSSQERLVCVHVVLVSRKSLNPVNLQFFVVHAASNSHRIVHTVKTLVVNKRGESLDSCVRETLP